MIAKNVNGFFVVVVRNLLLLYFLFDSFLLAKTVKMKMGRITSISLFLISFHFAFFFFICVKVFVMRNENGYLQQRMAFFLRKEVEGRTDDDE